MALGDRIGHDKRGNVVYRRDSTGHEIVVEVEDAVRSRRNGQTVYEVRRRQEKVVDDNTLDIARAFRDWLSGVAS